MKLPKKLVVAVSGGVDSSVAAALYREKGVELVAVTLKMRSCENMPDKRKSCCGIEDDMHARGAAEKLGIPHYFLNVQNEFEEKVLKKAWQEYACGRTPNPCALCNRYLKFGTLIDYALKLGAEGIITGHYAIIENNTVRRGLDTGKDQTYFLFGLTPEQIGRSFMPLGPFKKSEVREMARKFGLPNAEKTESQDACFGYKDETFAQTLQKLFKGKSKKGFLKDRNGKVLGEHDGIHLFTIGQRKGLGIALGVPAYVINIDSESGDVIVSKDEKDLMCNNLMAKEINWQIAGFADRGFRCMAQIRYRSRPVPVTVSPGDGCTLNVHFERPQRAVTSGQAVVFYEGDMLIGGAWIV
ncbi:MAG: tRNA 2-thiouridine(34) synthase MnmA [Victivallales bacterium]